MRRRIHTPTQNKKNKMCVRHIAWRSRNSKCFTDTVDTRAKSTGRPEGDICTKRSSVCYFKIWESKTQKNDARHWRTSELFILLPFLLRYEMIFMNCRCRNVRMSSLSLCLKLPYGISSYSLTGLFQHHARSSAFVSEKYVRARQFKYKIFLIR